MCGEHVGEFQARAAQACLHGVLRNPEDRGDLPQWQAFERDQHQHLALGKRQLIDGAIQPGAGFGNDRASIGIGPWILMSVVALQRVDWCPLDKQAVLARRP